VKIGIIHYSLNPCGGGERLCLTTIEVLKKEGYEVKLITVEKTDWNKVRKMSGKEVKPDKEIALFSFEPRVFAIYQRLLGYFLAYRFSKECDLTLNTHGDVMPVPCDIAYMHYPTFIEWRKKPETIMKYRKSVYWRLYFAPYEFMQTRLVKWYIDKSFILTNSSYSAEAIWRQAGKRAKVIYPPVDVSRFFNSLEVSRENVVVTCGRFTPEKHLDKIPEIASKVPDAQFIITGSTLAKGSLEIIRRIRSRSKELMCRNVEIIPNVSLKRLIEIYGKSKVYLHTMIGEHFGISVVEAMASGLVPVVHSTGGPWLDILEQGLHNGRRHKFPSRFQAFRDLNNGDVTSNVIGSVKKCQRLRLKLFSQESFKIIFQPKPFD